MTYDDCRAQYPEFVFESYDIAETAEELTVTYTFTITGLKTFYPTWRFPKPVEKKQAARDLTVRRLVFWLGMVELISYWKITCSPTVRVLCGYVDEAAVTWWKKQYYLGLGEFFYVNGIQADPDGFMTLISAGEEPTGETAGGMLSGCLIPIGGGKDSAVTLELLQDRRETNACYIINPRGATWETVRVAGYDRAAVLTPKRTLDAGMLELNRQGYLNGHTPFSAIVAFSGLLTAYLFGKEYVVLSNESSANESTVPDSEVNHQYSKSVQFEEDLRSFEKRYIDSGVQYFSLLRPWSELQIARYFACFCKPYHPVFRSCNVGSKQDIWCGKCPKCLFVSLILSPFVSIQELYGIFGRPILEDTDLLPLLQKLCGLVPEKPFECVGSREEVNTALCLTVARLQRHGEPLPALLQAYTEQPLYAAYRHRANPFEGRFETRNCLPPVFETIMRKATDVMKEDRV